LDGRKNISRVRRRENFTKIHALIIALVIILVFFSGCLSSPAVHNSAQGDLHAHNEYTEGWSIGQGCYERVNGYVYNAGNMSDDGVQLHFNLVNTGTGTIRDSRSIFIGPLVKGETRTYEVVLDGECTQEYRVDFMFGE
jgi:hypothetical protein